MAVGEPAVNLPGCIVCFIFKDSVSFEGVGVIASSSYRPFFFARHFQ